jgi:hypothetical protein
MVTLAAPVMRYVGLSRLPLPWEWRVGANEELEECAFGIASADVF